MLVLGCTSNIFLAHKNIENWDFLMLLLLDFSLFFQFMKEMKYWEFWMLA